jgi:surface carbohydrate biosynthesis protein
MSFRHIRKLWRLLHYFIAADKVWCWPRRSDVLIYDQAGARFLLEYLAPWAPEILHVRQEKIYVPIILWSLFRSGNKANAYIDCYIQKVSPRLVITNIDNDIRFCSLKGRNKNITTMFVQNGPRGSEIFSELEERVNSLGPFEVDYMMIVAARYSKPYRDHVRGTVIPMGSLRNNLVARRHETTPGVIAFISQFRDTPGFVWGGKYRSREEFFELPDKLVLSFLIDYAESHNKDLVIIPSSVDAPPHALEGERDYYTRLMGRKFKYAPKTWHGSSYDATDTAEIVVGIDSALGYESIARGNKTAIFAFRSLHLSLADRVFGWPENHPEEGPFWTNAPDTKAFRRILDHLLEIDDLKWRQELEDLQFDRVMAYDPGNTILQDALKKILVHP